MITCTRRIQFCAGHRVMKHESKCRHIHGHNYVVFFHAFANDLDKIGRVIDFGVLKKKLGGWIETHWDHGFIHYEEDDEVNAALDLFDDREGITQKRYAMPCNPTAENMAHYLLEQICPVELLGTGITIVKVVVWETENCFATAEKP